MDKIKRVYIIFLMLFFFSSCDPIITNDEKTLNEIFDKDSFDIEITSTGCFAGAADIFYLKKRESDYLLIAKNTGKNHSISQVKIDSLKIYMHERMGNYYSTGCSVGENIRIGTFFQSVDFEHTDCSGANSSVKIDKLLGVYSLTIE